MPINEENTNCNFTGLLPSEGSMGHGSSQEGKVMRDVDQSTEYCIVSFILLTFLHWWVSWQVMTGVGLGTPALRPILSLPSGEGKAWPALNRRAATLKWLTWAQSYICSYKRLQFYNSRCLVMTGVGLGTPMPSGQCWTGIQLLEGGRKSKMLCVNMCRYWKRWEVLRCILMFCYSPQLVS